MAIPAFRMAELREAALPMLNELLTREKECRGVSESEFKRFPLVQEVEETLRLRARAQLSQPEKE